MNAEFKEKWLKALRSGNYKQGKRYLKKGGQYCCLGVLCDVVDSGKWNDKTHDGSFTYLSLDMSVKTDLSEKQQGILVDLNDVSGKSFVEIADYIERNL